MTTIFSSLLNLFFPRLCLLCKVPLVEGEDQLCLQCLCDLPRTRYASIDNNPMIQLFIGKTDITHAAAFLYYEKGGKVQQLIHLLKYHGNKEIGFRLGYLAAQEYLLRGLFNGIDLLMPVPLHPRKKKKRGYNQSESIARGINSLLNLPIDTTSLYRTKQTDTQTQKQVYDRWLNVQKTFSVIHPNKLQNKHILLIDDVITTGSTLEACAESLLSIPGVKVSLLVIAIA